MTFIIGTPHTKNSGYFRNDDRLSGGKLSEADIQTCPHCQGVIKMQEWRVAKTQNFCTGCMKPTCDQLDCEPCIPYLKRLDERRNWDEKYRTFVKMAGLEPPPVPQPIITDL